MSYEFLAWEVICVWAINLTLKFLHWYSLWNCKKPTAGIAVILKPGYEPVFTSVSVSSECCQSIHDVTRYWYSVHKQIFRSEWNCHTWPLTVVWIKIIRSNTLPLALSSVSTASAFLYSHSINLFCFGAIALTQSSRGYWKAKLLFF